MESPSEALKKYLAVSDKRPSVLIADDDAGFVSRCREKLVRCGCNVAVAHTPEEGFEQFMTAPFGFDVIFVDLNFPDYPGAEGGWELTEKIVSATEQRGFNVAPQLICLSGSQIDELSEATKRHARPILKGRGADAVVFEVLHAIKFLDQLTAGLKIVIRHVSSIRDREYSKPEVRRYNFDLYPESAAVVLPDGLIEMKELKDAPLAMLDLLAWAIPQGPLRWNDLLRKANTHPYFRETLPSALFKTDNRDYLKVLVARVRAGLRNVLQDARINLKVDDVFASYYRDPLTEKFIRVDERESVRRTAEELKNTYPKLTDLLKEDKNAYYQLHAWVEIENCHPSEAE